MTDRPIIFSAPIVQALLAGRKTQTRRVLRNQPANVYFNDESSTWFEWWYEGREPCGAPTREVERPLKLPYSVGDRLWVREAHAISANIDLPVWFRLGHEEAKAPGPRVDVKWRPSIHMPRWVSRLTLIVDDVRIERLQDISEDDARAEGVRKVAGFFQVEKPNRMVAGCTSARAAYALLWHSLNAKRAPWSSNPWVAAISFRVVKTNIDKEDA